jgi:adenylate cyclase class 2
MEKMETEVKFYVVEIDSIRERICQLGAVSKGRFFEKNLRFEDADKSFKANKTVLRLRQDNKAKLTFKSKPLESDNQFKKLEELEVEVSDFETMNRILQVLGFHCEQIYEKWRETLVLNQTQFCIDSMPYGNFLEIEGPEENIKDFASQLGLQWNQRIILNYIEIFDTLKENLNLKFNDISFENFDGVNVDLAIYLNMLTADKS